MKNKCAIIFVALFVSLFSSVSFAQPIRQNDYTTAIPLKSNMYAPPTGYRLAKQSDVSRQLSIIAQKILFRAINEHWAMPSEIPLYFDGKQYIARYQFHGPNKQNPKKHPGIGLYEKLTVK
jgi:hypothetical protein